MTEKRNSLAKLAAENGFTIFKANGKKGPKGWSTAPFIEPDDVDEYLGSGKGNYGILIPKDVLCIDVDIRNFDKGDNPLKRLMEDVGVSMTESCARILSGGGGLHLYYRIPEGLQIQENQTKYKGLEFKMAGRFMVGPGSVHPDTNKVYVMKEPFSNMADAPKELLKVIGAKKRKEYTTSCEQEIIIDDSPVAISQYQSYLDAADPAVEGENGDGVTFAVACKGRDFGLSQEKVVELMEDNFNPRCEPSWSSEALAVKVGNAFAYAKGVAGVESAVNDFDEVEMSDELKAEGSALDWKKVYRNGKKIVKPTKTNCANYLSCPIVAPELNDMLSYNLFDETVRIVKNPPWAKGKSIPKDGRTWTNWDSDALSLHLCSKYAFEVNDDMIRKAYVSVAHRREFHPVRDYLTALEWDGKSRLDHWLIDHCGAKDEEYSRIVAKIMCLQAVGRAMHPGCKADILCILEGKQGCGKSAVCEIMAKGFGASIYVDPSNKDTIQSMMGVWINEVAEMDVMHRAKADLLKAFITRAVDKIRLPYASIAQDYPRQGVMWGTKNKDVSDTYFNDSTGNRRFMGVEIGQVDFKGLEGAVDQIWAEAMHRLYMGEDTWVSDVNEQKLVEKEQAARLNKDAWFEPVHDWVINTKPHFVTTMKVWEFALMGAKPQFTRDKSVRLIGILKQLGYEPHKQRIDGKVTSGYVNARFSEDNVNFNLEELM
jgi:hypothetical protein